MLAELEDKIGGSWRCFCVGELAPPGVYFYFDPKEPRSDTGKGNRVVYVGETGCIGRRLCEHWWGSRQNSQYQQVVGEAIIKSRNLDIPSWGSKKELATRKKAALFLGIPKQEINSKEYSIDVEVSEYIQSMSVLYVSVNDLKKRRMIERNAIALLSNYCPNIDQLDRHSRGWVGCHSGREKLCNSGLWCEMKKKQCDPVFLKILAGYVKSHPGCHTGVE